LVIKVIIKSIKPSSISEEICKELVASVNSFAITLARVLAGSKRVLGIAFLFPITIVTAIVSPNALPRDKPIPANIPLRI
jgi:hypothetical protein